MEEQVIFREVADVDVFHVIPCVEMGGVRAKGAGGGLTRNLSTNSIRCDEIVS
jgi:hypothetical protein